MDLTKGPHHGHEEEKNGDSKFVGGSDGAVILGASDLGDGRGGQV